MYLPLTWLPAASISKSIHSLSDQDLGRTWDISYDVLRTRLGCRNPVHSPLVKLWRGWETALANYTWHVATEQLTRKPELAEDPDMRHSLFLAMITDAPRIQSGKVHMDLSYLECPTPALKNAGLLPGWFGWRPFHESHQKALYTGDASTLVWPWENSGKVHSAVLQGRQGGGSLHT